MGMVWDVAGANGERSERLVFPPRRPMAGDLQRQWAVPQLVCDPDGAALVPLSLPDGEEKEGKCDAMQCPLMHGPWMCASECE